MSYFIQQIVYGLSAGSIYALIALGYTMVYGIVKLINFAHGEVLMMGAYFTIFGIISFNIPIILALPISMVLCALLGMFIDRVAYKPLRNAPRISALITALGVSMFLSNFFKLLFGAEKRKMPDFPALKGGYVFGDVTIPYKAILTLVLTLVCLITLQIIVRKTKVGRAMRAVSEDKQAAQLMGVNVDLTISITFAIGSALAAVGGVLYAINYSQIFPTMGTLTGLKAFVAAVLGGIGILPGAMFGGFLIGIVENLTKGYGAGGWSNAVVFGILIIVLLVKPEGIFGKNTREKV
ncbi:MAG: branched-chain amino acid ABC transporter permease [Vallitaleaceae bacterium]|jgi:branched-chain amino acid transport system permease protein|nr:branched-chain amino acid ABC transporter permease [Vallitaleaceae bacterium]